MARSENLTIMFTDIVGFTAKTSNQTRAENAAMLKEHDRLLLPIVANFGGRRVKSIGDAMLVTFRSPTDAVRCGMGLQDAIADRNRNADGQDKLTIRVALALGDVRIEAGDVFGEPVNVAARIESMTPPEEVYFGQSVYLAMNRAEVTTEAVGEYPLKGIPEPVQIYRVVPLDASVSSPGDSAYFPFGGMHRSRSESSTLVARAASSASATAGRVLDKALAKPKLTASVLLAVLLAVPLLLWPHRGSVLDEARPHVERGEWAVVEALAEGEEPNSAEATLLRGHIACGRKSRQRCLNLYRGAFERDRSLSEDSIAVANIVQALGFEAALSRALLTDFPSNASRDALVARTQRAGYWGRRRAVETLSSLGESARVDPVEVSLADLKDGPSCEKRLQAVRALGETDDARAIPALREASSGKTIFDRNRCLREVAKKVLSKLEDRREVSP